MPAREYLFLLFSLFLFSCSPGTPAVTPQVISVYSTYAALPWLTELYDCAGVTSVIERVDSPDAAQIILRVGEPEFLSSFAFQIDEEEILIVSHRQGPVENLTFEAARALFTGQGDPSVQVWVYPPDEDVQEVFDRVVMEGESVTPDARLAVDPQQMPDALVNEPDTVGILSRHWKTGDTRELLSVATVPVLAMTRSEPQGSINQLIDCLQK